MKRLVIMLFSFILTVSIIAVPAAAAEVNVDTLYTNGVSEINNHFWKDSPVGEDANEANLTSEPVFGEYTVVYRNYYNPGPLKYGTWRNGVSGGSPLEDTVLHFNNATSVGYDLSFTTTFSGEYTISNAAKIALDLGVTLNATKTYELGSGYDHPVPKGKRYRILYRPAYYRYTVTEIEYWEAFINGSWQSFEMGQKISYVNVFSHWDYTGIDITNEYTNT